MSLKIGEQFSLKRDIADKYFDGNKSFLIIGLTDTALAVRGLDNKNVYNMSIQALFEHVRWFGVPTYQSAKTTPQPDEPDEPQPGEPGELGEPDEPNEPEPDEPQPDEPEPNEPEGYSITATVLDGKIKIRPSITSSSVEIAEDEPFDPFKGL